MNARIDFFANPVAGKVLRHINSAGKAAGTPVCRTPPRSW